jgi:cell division protein ZapA (FtsZ GTPase activity inhibitor)
MTEANNEALEFEILGYKVNFKSDTVNSLVSPTEIVGYVKDEVAEMRKNAKHLSTGEVAVLLALKMAQEKLLIEREYRENIIKLHQEVNDAKKVIDGLSI